MFILMVQLCKLYVILLNFVYPHYYLGRWFEWQEIAVWACSILSEVNFPVGFYYYFWQELVLSEMWSEYEKVEQYNVLMGSSLECN